jgi:hypothetical protein
MPEELPVINTKDSQTSGAYSKNNEGGWNVDSQQVDSYTEQLRGMEEGLPANDKSDSTVHWLGSSYSGADIKIVVHMYEDIGELGYETSLQKQIDDTNAMINAFQALNTGALGAMLADLDISPKYETGALNLFERIQKLVGRENDSEVALHVYGLILSAGASGTVNQRLARITSVLESNIQTYTSLRESLQEQLDNLHQIRADQYSTFTLATAQTLSLQTHREKHPVRALGHSNVKGYTRGQRTIAGSIIFTMFNEHALASLIRKMGSSINKFDPSPAGENQISSLLADQLPPIDITIVFANEYGSLSRGGLYGVEFMNSGVTLSIEDLLTEEVVNFVARDADPIISVGRVGIDKKQRGMHFNSEGMPATGTDLLFANQSSYEEYLGKLGVRRRFRNR